MTHLARFDDTVVAADRRVVRRSWGSAADGTSIVVNGLASARRGRVVGLEPDRLGMWARAVSGIASVPGAVQYRRGIRPQPTIARVTAAAREFGTPILFGVRVAARHDVTQTGRAR